VISTTDLTDQKTENSNTKRKIMVTRLNVLYFEIEVEKAIKGLRGKRTTGGGGGGGGWWWWWCVW
jgi:hypothetical protein